MKRKQTKFNADRILSVSAIVIALASVGVSVWEGYETRLHNRLSVRPKIEIIGDVEQTCFGLAILNNGLGPAVIRDNNILLDGKPFDRRGLGGLDVLLDSLGLPGRLAAKGVLDAGTTVPSGDRENLFFLNRQATDDLAAIIDKIEKRVRIEIHYTSMYGERFDCVWP
jgi:hypothetical protein